MRSVNVLRAFARGCTACAILAVAGAAQAQISEDWSSGTENGWTVSSLNFTGNNWTFDPFLGEWFAADVVGAEAQYLTSPTFTLGADLGLEIEHWFDLEENGAAATYDGGIVEVSVNGGAFMPFAATFSGEAYRGPVSANFENPLAGLNAFSGTSSAGVGGFVTSVFNLGAFATTGDMVQVRFTLGTDISVAADGWSVTRVTSVPIVDPAGACCFGDGTCTDTTMSGCSLLGGTFNEGVVCSTGLCPVLTPGDTCAGAIMIPTVPYNGFVGNMEEYAAGPDLLSCNAAGANQNHDVWWSFAGTGQRMRLEFFDDNFTFDEIVGVFEGTDCGALTQLGCEDFLPIAIDFDTQVGMTYYIVVSTWSQTPLADTGNEATIVLDLAPPAPANNECSAPEILTQGVSVAGTTVGGNGVNESSCGFHENDVWYALAPAPNTHYRVSTSGATANMSLSAFQQDCPPLGTELTCADPAGNDAFAYFMSDGIGSAILIRAATDDGVEATFNIVVDLAPPAPTNDDCANAQVVNPGDMVFGSNAASTTDGTATCGFNGNSDLWFSLTAPTTGLYTLDTCGSNYDTTLAVFEGCGGAQVACNDDSACGAQSMLNVNLTSGTTYLIRLAAYGTGPTEGDFMLTVSPAPIPTGACCMGTSCSVMSEADCAGVSGAYQGDDTSCGDFVMDDTIPVNFEDIAFTGTPIFLTDDSVSSAQPIGFPFQFYGVEYTDVYVSSNGFISFDPAVGSGCCTGQAIPSTTTPNNLIAVAWEDFNPALGGGIYVQTLGTAPNRVFIVQYDMVPHCCSGTNPTVTAQAKLFEGSNNIELHYNSLQQDAFTEMTIGIENQDGTQALQYFRGTGLPALAPTFAVSFGLTASPCDGGPTCACETDGNDAQVNVFDLLAYLNLWFPQAPAADIDGTPGVNVFDLLFFLDCWFPASAGTPC